MHWWTDTLMACGVFTLTSHGIRFAGLFGRNGLYMMILQPCWIPPWSNKHTHSSPPCTHIQLRSMVINLISDRPDTCTHEAFSHCFSSSTHTHILSRTHRIFFPPFSLLSIPWHTCQGPCWPLTPPHLAPLLIFPPTLSIWDEGGWKWEN